MKFYENEKIDSSKFYDNFMDEIKKKMLEKNEKKILADSKISKFTEEK